jgi:pimeloyl-ACP methyl ester carboxylesterase
MGIVQTVRGGQLDIAYERHGNPEGWPVVLLHGFPYDPRCYDNVAERVADSGADVVVPYMRGYGPTTYLTPETFRSGQQAAFAQDLRDLITGLDLRRPIVAGFDWGGRAACVAAMVWPELVSGLVSVGGYNVLDNATMATTPEAPLSESRNWYQWYFHSERGRRGLDRYRREFTRQLWDEWSPSWPVPAGTFEKTAVSFDNPDFVATVVHSYRHRYGLAPGDPTHETIERIVAEQPPILVPTLVIDSADPLQEPETVEVHHHHFPNLIEHRTVDTGHNVPQEAPEAFADAIVTLRRHIA